MKKNLRWVRHRRPRTTSEARANQDGWCRPGRRYKNLPNSWSSHYLTYEKSWKQKRRTQYYPDGRGKEHSIIVDYYSIHDWNLRKYFEDHNIPYRIENVREQYWFKKTLWKKVPTGWKKPVYHTTRTKKDGKPVIIRRIIRWEPEYKWEKNGYEMIRSYRIIAHKITWWYDKNIGLEYILKE